MVTIENAHVHFEAATGLCIAKITGEHNGELVETYQLVATLGVNPRIVHGLALPIETVSDQITGPFGEREGETSINVPDHIIA